MRGGQRWYNGSMTQYLLPGYDSETRLKYILPILEFLVGIGLPRRQALIELGYTEEKVDEMEKGE